MESQQRMTNQERGLGVVMDGSIFNHAEAIEKKVNSVLAIRKRVEIQNASTVKSLYTSMMSFIFICHSYSES